jgi:L-alanine-DL-glutamate epimerase-like enolase superfamily enzyme
MGRVGHARNQRIIASTSKLGFGAVVEFLKTDKTLDYAVALGAPTWDAAVNEAKKKAKSLGGRAFRVWRGWNDGLRTNQPIIMQKL